MGSSNSSRPEWLKLEPDGVPVERPVRLIDFSLQLDQLQSILFAIPAEIRNRIFQLALTTLPDPERPYSPSDTWYRPGFHFYPRVSTSLLLTCRRIYAETRLHPILANDHIFWYGNGRAPTNLKHASDAVAYFTALSSEERSRVKSVWWFAQQCEMEGGWLENPARIFKVLPDPEFRPERMKITIRMTDWWWWEQRHRLSVEPLFQPGWVAQFKHVPDLQTFELEMEMIQERKLELGPITDRLKALKIDLGKGKWLLPEEKLQSWTWMGPDSYNNDYVNGSGKVASVRVDEDPAQWNRLTTRQRLQYMGQWRPASRARGSTTTGALRGLLNGTRGSSTTAGPLNQTGGSSSDGGQGESAGLSETNSSPSAEERLTNTPYYVVNMVWKATELQTTTR